MKFFLLLLCFIFLSLSFSSFSAFSLEEETVFELKRESKKSKQQTGRKKSVPLKFKRHFFSYNKDFLIFNEKPTFSLQKGSALKVNIPYPVIASFTEEFPLYGVMTYPFGAVLSGKIKAIKNTNKALINFDEMIVNDESSTIETFPVFVDGDLRESLFKEIALSFLKVFPQF